VEVWQIANLTADPPNHFHLVNVQILYRQAIKMKGFVGTFTITPMASLLHLILMSSLQGDSENEPGGGDNRHYEVRLPTLPFVVPDSPRTGGKEYVWHCHILEHEEQI